MTRAHRILNIVLVVSWAVLAVLVGLAVVWW